MSKTKTYIKTILLPVGVGIIVGLLISKFIDYDELVKPKFSPSSMAFPIAWTILYVLMGISYGMLKINRQNDASIKRIYYIQLIVNAVWSLIFFILKNRLLAAIWIVLLDVLVIIMISRFYKKNTLAGLLQIPYIIWTLFATYLSIAIYNLNK